MKKVLRGQASLDQLKEKSDTVLKSESILENQRTSCLISTTC